MSWSPSRALARFVAACPQSVWACGLLTLFTLISFCQVVEFGFVNIDDPEYVYENAAVQQGLFAPIRLFSI